MLQPKIRVKFFEQGNGKDLEKAVNNWIDQNPKFKVISSSTSNYYEDGGLRIATSYTALVTYEIIED